MSLIIFVGCEELNSPDKYIQYLRPGKISVIVYSSGNLKTILLSWENYVPRHSGFEIQRDFEIMDTVTITSYYNYLLDLGTYEYRIYALNGNDKSLPSYVKIRLDFDGYELWYE